MPPQSLQPAAIWGRQTPIMSKRPETDARTHAPERFCKTPVNCPHCGQLWSPITPEAAPGFYPASSFVLASSPERGQNRPKSPRWDWDSAQPRKVAHSGLCGATRGVLGGGLSLPSARAAGCRNLRGRVSERFIFRFMRFAHPRQGRTEYPAFPLSPSLSAAQPQGLLLRIDGRSTPA